MHQYAAVKSSSGRAPPCQGGSEFEPRRPLQQGVEYPFTPNMVTWPSGKGKGLQNPHPPVQILVVTSKSSQLRLPGFLFCFCFRTCATMVIFTTRKGGPAMPAGHHTTPDPGHAGALPRAWGPRPPSGSRNWGIVTLADLLCHYPRRYIDFPIPTPLPRPRQTPSAW